MCPESIHKQKVTQRAKDGEKKFPKENKMVHFSSISLEKNFLN